MAVETATTTPPVQDPQTEEQPQEKSLQDAEQNASSLLQAQAADPLRNAPTFKEDIAAGRDEDDGAAAAEKPKSPGLVAKVMEKLGLNSFLLKCMFKSVPLPTHPVCAPKRFGMSY